MNGLDRISELPDDLKEKLLVRLPIEEAIKTSFLSTKWRYTWTYIPDLVFKGATVDKTGDSLTRASKLAKLVDIVLLLHHGPIRKSTLQYYYPHLSDAVHRWMVILSGNGIRELDICLDVELKWKMPSSFFSASTLTSVRLEHCVLKPPRSFNGLKLLKSLCLAWCSIGDRDLENLISSCSHLENLTLACMDGLFVRIRAPKLKHIYLFLHDLKYLQLITPILVKANLDVEFTVEKSSCKKILKDVFSSLCNIETLKIGYSFMEVLASSGNMEFPVKLSCLKELVCFMDPSNQKENTFAVSMFQNAPSLETLEIIAQNFPKSSTATFWEPTMPTTSFGNLKLVKIIVYQEFLVDFLLPLVKLLLATSPVLASLRFAIRGAAETAMCLKKLRSFQRASKEVQIFVDSLPIY